MKPFIKDAVLSYFIVKPIMFAKSSILVKCVYCQKVLLLRTSTPNKSVNNKWKVLCYLCDDVTHTTLLKCQNIMNNEFQLILKYSSLLSMFCKNMYIVSLFVWRIAAMIQCIFIALPTAEIFAATVNAPMNTLLTFD